MSETSFDKAFKSWKIYLAVFLGLFFAIFMIYKSLQEVHFVKSKNGTHTWVDSNHNNKVDFKLDKEFVTAKKGEYRIKSNIEFLEEINWTTKTFLFLGLAVVFMIFRDVAYMWRIKTLTSNQLTWKSSFFVIMLWEFASALSPGVVGGAAVAMFILKKEKIPLGKSTAIVIITAMMDNLFYILMIPLVLIFVSPENLFPNQSNFDKSIGIIFWTGFSLIFLVCLFLFLSIFFFPNFVKGLLTVIFKIPFLKKWKSSASKTGQEVASASKEFRKEKFSFWFKSFFATLLSWTSRYLVINCVLAAFLSIGFKEHVMIYAKQLVLWLFMLISPTPGASGVAEYAFGELLGDFSSSTVLIVALALIWRLISYFPYLIIGAFLLPRWIKRKS